MMRTKLKIIKETDHVGKYSVSNPEKINVKIISNFAFFPNMTILCLAKPF
jgi:hypothetical protein